VRIWVSAPSKVTCSSLTDTFGRSTRPSSYSTPMPLESHMMRRASVNGVFANSRFTGSPSVGLSRGPAVAPVVWAVAEAGVLACRGRSTVAEPFLFDKVEEEGTGRPIEDPADELADHRSDHGAFGTGRARPIGAILRVLLEVPFGLQNVHHRHDGGIGHAALGAQRLVDIVHRHRVQSPHNLHDGEFWGRQRGMRRAHCAPRSRRRSSPSSHWAIFSSFAATRAQPCAVASQR
jgi:hypothetical protein